MASQNRKTWLAICIACVAGAEGLRQVAYRDPVGIPTICFGETRGVKLGDRATVEECKDLLAERVLEFAERLADPACVGKEAMDKLPAPTKAAVVSITYNTGPGKFGVKDGICELKKERRPSTLALNLRAGRLAAACAEFSKWANPPLPGIVKRRETERRLCMEGVEGEFGFKPTLFRLAPDALFPRNLVAGARYDRAGLGLWDRAASKASRD